MKTQVMSRRDRKATGLILVRVRASGGLIYQGHTYKCGDIFEVDFNEGKRLFDAKQVYSIESIDRPGHQPFIEERLCELRTAISVTS